MQCELMELLLFHFDKSPSLFLALKKKTTSSPSLFTFDFIIPLETIEVPSNNSYSPLTKEKV